MQYLIIAFIALIIGSYTDFKTREVPDWLSYGLVFTGVFLHLLASLIYSEWVLLLKSIAGLAVAAAVAIPMFYLGQWGGGDSKMLMALGSIIGLDFSYSAFLVSLLVNIFLLGAIYGILYGAVLAVRHKNNFWDKFKKVLYEKKNIKLRMALLIVCTLIFVISFFAPSLRIALLLLILVLIISFYLWAFVKAVEKAVMYKLVSPAKLTEGDWIAKDVMVKGRKICGPKDLGVTLKQIRELKRLKVKKILIKEGIPFVPSYLLAFLFTCLFGNILLIFI